MGLDTEQIRQFKDNGYLLIRGMFTDVEVSAMRAKVADYLEGRACYPEHWLQTEAAVKSGEVQIPQPSRGLRKLAMITLVDPLFHDMVSKPKFAAVLQGCLGENVCAWGSGIFLKQAAAGGRQPWHRDIHGYGGPAATIWTALMDATVENGYLQIAPGTHLVEPLDNADQEQEFQDGRFRWKITPLAMKAGDTVIWNMKTLHSSEPNRSNASRWALAVHCVTTEAAIEAACANPNIGPHEIVAGNHDATTARAARCMHCDKDAFTAFGPAGGVYG